MRLLPWPTTLTSGTPSCRSKRAVFDVLWRLTGAARLEAVTPAGTRYAVIGDIDAARSGWVTPTPTT